MDSNRSVDCFSTGTCVFLIVCNALVAAYPISFKNWIQPWQTDVEYKLDAWSQYDNPEEGTGTEGDIRRPSRKTMLKDSHALWPDGIVRYFVDDTIAKEPDKWAILEEAMDKIMESTCVKFVRIYPDSDGNFPFPAWVNMTGREKGCFADLGCPEISPSTLNLSVDKCFRVKGHALHEILHTLGAIHEHMRPDRNQYIKILWDNVQEGGRGNFEIMSPNKVTTHGLPYDYDSVMHYSMTAFSRDKSKPTIVSRRPGVTLGQRTHLSRLDIKKLLISYKCEKQNWTGPHRQIIKTIHRQPERERIELTLDKPIKLKSFRSRFRSKKLRVLDPWVKFRLPQFVRDIFSIIDSDEDYYEDYYEDY